MSTEMFLCLFPQDIYTLHLCRSTSIDNEVEVDHVSAQTSEDEANAKEL